jgi:hypothetical protein
MDVMRRRHICCYSSKIQLFRRPRVGVRLYVAPLLVHHAAQFALHRFECVVDHLVERLVRAIVHLPFVSNEFVTPRHSHIDAAPVRIAFLMGVIGLLNGHIAAVDVVAKFFQSCRIFQNEIVDLVRLFQTPIRDLNRQLHIQLDINELPCVEGTKMFLSILVSHLLQ